MNIAVLSMTRDRLDYSRHCFARLREHAGCDYTHFVLDQGSKDGTTEWLHNQPDLEVTTLDTNIGISRGFNLLLEECVNPDDWDVIVKVDNDCELVQMNTLKDVCELTLKGGALLSPRIMGLQNPPQPTREVQIAGEVILDVPQIGGIFLAAPAWIYNEFRYSSDNPYWGLDDVQVCAWFREKGGTCGYVKRLEAWHHESTDGQRARFPDYFARKDAEYAA